MSAVQEWWYKIKIARLQEPRDFYLGNCIFYRPCNLMGEESSKSSPQRAQRNTKETLKALPLCTFACTGPHTVLAFGARGLTCDTSW